MICSEALVTTVANWFKRNIGLASGIATCGERGAVFEAVINLVEVRLNKAGSV